MGYNGEKEVVLGHVLGRVGRGTTVIIGKVSYDVVKTSAFPGVFGDWFLFDYTVLNVTSGPCVEHLSPYSKVESVVVTRRVFPKDAGFLERFHGFLVDRGWH